MPRPSSGGVGWAGQRVSQVRGRDCCGPPGMVHRPRPWYMHCTFAYQQDTAQGHEFLDGVPRTRISDQTRPDRARLRTYGSSTIENAGMERQQFDRKHDTNMDPAITMTPAGAVDLDRNPWAMGFVE
ncbi:hypothetical protein CEP53_012786 [Fusarium sp. AF-6]|nr:hypothetical protein CEP53_012786 [Fusarium sp. AF-6]